MTTVFEFYVSEKDRKKTVELLTEFFKKKDAITVEKGIYDFTRQYCESNNCYMIMSQGIYNDCAKNIIFNCEQNHSTMQNIRNLIDKKAYNPYNLAFLSPEELDNDNWWKIILRRNTTEDKLKNLPTIEWKVCKQCKNVEYFYYQLQTRCADEPMTTFYICKECGKTYKVNN